VRVATTGAKALSEAVALQITAYHSGGIRDGAQPSVALGRVSGSLLLFEACRSVCAGVMSLGVVPTGVAGIAPSWAWVKGIGSAAGVSC
jgi:hypothetical protein